MKNAKIIGSGYVIVHNCDRFSCTKLLLKMAVEGISQYITKKVEQLKVNWLTRWLTIVGIIL